MANEVKDTGKEATPPADTAAGKPAPEAKEAAKPEGKEAAPAAAPEKKDEGKPAPKEAAKPEAQGKEAKKDSEKPEEKPAEPKFDLKLPKDSRLDAARVEELTSFAKKEGLSPEQAQAILNREDQAFRAQAEGGPEWKKRIQAYESEIASDKEVGGDDFKKNAELAKRVVDRFGNEALKTGLQASGFGSHPALFKFCVKIGKAMGEDSFFAAEKPGSSAKGKDPASVLYGGEKAK